MGSGLQLCRLRICYGYNMGANKPELVNVWTGAMQSEEVTVEIK